ncbi:MAG: guanylate kinase [Synergistaceae bacterium]|nr:guanylate kinase [Synergistaceae bacterium]
MRGTLFIFSGPAGVGKGTVLKLALGRLSNIKYSVSCTTRSPRPNSDKEGESYYFISEDEFRSMIKAGAFLEYARVHGHLYGTRRDFVEKTLEAGTDIVLEIDVQGAFIVKKNMPEAVSIFVKPPSMEELNRRLRGRNSESDEEQALRIRNAAGELDCADSYDYIIVNDVAERAAEEFIKIVKSYREETI